MTAFYNEIDLYAAQWLENLISAGHIMPGKVERKSIHDLRADELTGYERAHFFAGIAGWDLALQLAGWPAGRPVWTGSCPCQPFSSAGQKRGNDDPRHLWPIFRTLIAEQRPPVVFGEQVASKDGRAWLWNVRAHMDVLGYRFAASDLCAAGIGAPHIRQRLYWVAHLDGQGLANHEGRPGQTGAPGRPITSDAPPFDGVHRWLPESADGWCVHGISAKVGAVRAYGNAIVPQVAAEFIAAFLETEGVTHA